MLERACLPFKLPCINDGGKKISGACQNLLPEGPAGEKGVVLSKEEKPISKAFELLRSYFKSLTLYK